MGMIYKLSFVELPLGGLQTFAKAVELFCASERSLQISENSLQNILNKQLHKFVIAEPAINDMLCRLAGHYKLYLISNGSSDNQRQKIQAAGLQDIFSKVYISDEIGIAKPELFKTLIDSMSF